MITQSERFKKQVPKDRRFFERFSSHFPANLKDLERDAANPVFLEDASAWGVKLTSTKPVFLNERVLLEIHLPDGSKPIELNGRVAWVKKKEMTIWDVGLKFHRISLMTMSRLYKYTA